MGRIDTTSGPEMDPAGSQRTLVLYIGTFTFWSMCATGIPPSRSADSKVNEQPTMKVTRSSRQYSLISVGSATFCPSRRTTTRELPSTSYRDGKGRPLDPVASTEPSGW